MKSPSLKRKVVGSVLSAALISSLFTPVGHAEEKEQAKGQKEKNKPMWTQVWGDEFDDGKIDPTKWTFDLTNGASVGIPGWGNNELQYYTNRSKNVREEDGNLVIQAHKENYQGFDYTSARVKTKGLFSKKYGKFEIRASAPTGKGYWPAIWMLPEHNRYGGWAASGEIDIMEGWGSRPNTIAGTIHYGQQWPNNTYSGEEYTFKDGSTIEDFHTYAVEWEPGEIRWYVDGELYSVQNDWYSQSDGQPDTNAYPAPFDEEFHLIMNLAVGGNFDGNPTAETQFPKEMKIDYVRVYELTVREYREPTPPIITKEDYLPGAKLPQADGNLVYNNQFTETKAGDPGMGIEGTANWSLHKEPDGDAALSIEELNNSRFLKVNMLRPGGQLYSVQPQSIVSLAKGRFYKLTFDAKTEATRSIKVQVTGGASVGYAGYSPALNAQLTNEVQSYEVLFQMKKESDNAARIEFNLGTNDQPVWIGNAKLVEVEGIPFNDDIPKVPLSDGNRVYNGTFSVGEADGMSYWHVVQEGKMSASASVDPNERQLHIDVKKSSKHEDDLKLLQKGILLNAGDSYELSFDASTQPKGDVFVALTDEAGNVYEKQKVSVSSKTQKYHLVFKNLQLTRDDENAQLVFYLGGVKKSMTIDNIHLR
ncbi:family 16 glycosylhydrolase [Priestia flexa]|uniref:family 16 glycosylhydrolase n=1 Tax=Priestia flexa TaxID=86664 RepID=UPI001F4CC875|nr:family 16 glycosylhydrolase [Priestia flexa]